MSDKRPPKGSTPPRRRRRRLASLLVAGVSATLAAVVSVAPVTGATEAATDPVSRPSRHHPGSAPDTAVAQWNDIGSRAFTAAAAVPGAGLGPPEGHLIFAYAGIAVYDAVMAIRRTYEPFAIRTRAPRGSSAEAAVAAAAHRIYEQHLPTQDAFLDQAYADFLLGIPEGEAKDDGVAVGLRVANALIALRADDGFRDPVTYTPPNPPIPGVWLPTAAPPALPAGTYLPLMEPFALEAVDQFRPEGPPALASRRWAKDYNEVKEVGSRTSTTRTEEETTAALFWGEAPVQQAHGAMRGVITQRGLDLEQAARMMAMVSVAFADGTIACFDAKYHYKFWRPITAIRAGDTDSNAATEVDPAWQPLLAATPNHPDYPSAHSCITPAGAAALAEFLGTHHIDLDVPSLTGLGTRHFDTVLDLAREVGNARVWGGIHFRTAVRDGIGVALRTADAVLEDNFERTRSWKHRR